MNVLITGGAGFIGSHLAEYLSKEHNVIIYDNFSTGKKRFVSNLNCKIIKSDILNMDELLKAIKNIDICYHLAADPDVRESYKSPLKNFKINLEGSFNVLEACRKNDVSKIVFASSSVIYGRAKIPTPENAEIRPISNYGAAKASFEHYLSSYSDLYNINCVIVRYANIIGPRLTHGIIYDFYNKLKKNRKTLEILGDGFQEKSYLHVKDCIEATIFASRNMEQKFEVYNIGSNETITVKQIADILIDVLGLETVKYKYTGSKQGWPGDIPKMKLSINKLKDKGWIPNHSIEEAIIDSINFLRGID